MKRLSTAILEKQLGKELNTRKVYFEAFTQNNPDGYLLITTSGQIEAVNPAAMHLFNLEKQSNPLVSDFSFLTELPAYKKAITGCLETGSCQLDLALQVNDASMVKFAFTFSISNLPNAEVGILAVVRPAKDQNIQPANLSNFLLSASANKVNKENQERENIQVTSAAGTWQYDVNADKLEWSPELYSIYRLSSEVVPTMERHIDFIHPDDRPLVLQHIAKIVTHGLTFKVDHRIIRADKAIGYVQCSGGPRYNEAGEICGIFGVTLDITEKKQQEASLQQKASTLNKVMQYSPDILMTITIEGLITNISQSCEVILGYSPEEIIGKYYTNFVHPEDYQHIIEKLLELKEIKFTRNFEHRCIHKNGSLVTLQWSAYWSEEENNIFAIGRNFTELKLIQQKLVQSEERFRSLVQNGSDMMNILSAEGNYIYMSDSVRRILGYPTEIFLNKNVSEFIHPDDFLPLMHQIKSLKKQGQIAVAPFRFRAANGEWRWLESVVSNQLKNPSIKGIVVSSRDITDRKAGEIKIIESEQRYKSLFENHPDPVFSLDLQGRFTSVNSMVGQISGFTPEDMLGKSFEPLVFPEYLELTNQYFRIALSGTPCTYNTAIYSSTGERLDATITSIPIIVNGRVTGLFSIAKDISAQKKAEFERQSLINRLEQKNTNLQQFAYIVSHNLRAPVANILGLVSLFNNTTTENATNQEIINKLQQTTINLDSIIKELNQILMVRYDLTQVVEQVNFAEIIAAIRTSLADEIGKSAASIETDFSEVPSIESVKGYLYNILYYLISNAIKYRYPQRPLLIQIKTTITGEYVCLSVQDNALGIDLQKQKYHIFGFYKRFHSHVDSQGLGLHLIKNQVEALGGKFNIESEVGLGSLFKIYLINN